MNLPQWEQRLIPSITYNASLIAKHIPEDGLLYDIGANVGLITEYVMHEKPDISAVLFEPVKEFAEYCKQKFLNNPKVTVEWLGLSDQEATVNMIIDPYNLGYSRVNFNSNGDSHVIRLDEYIFVNEKRNIDVIKIDTEGHDPNVIYGTTEFLDKCKTTGRFPLILTEIGWNAQKEKELFEFLDNNYGYKIIEKEGDYLLKVI